MQYREKILLITACGAIAVWMGLPVLQRIFVTPIVERQSSLTLLGEEFMEKTSATVKIKQAGESLRRWRERSLPPVPLDAQRLYQAWLTDQAQRAGFSELRVAPGRRIERDSFSTSSLVTLEGKGTLAQLSEFLREFRQTDLLHRIASLKVDSRSAEEDPQLEFSLIAEGISLAGSPPREHLFPQTTLQADFRSALEEQVIDVKDSGLFPSGREFRVSLDNEFLQVLKSKAGKWTVVGGRDGSRPAAHKTGEIIALAPVLPREGDRSDEMRQQLVENSPFVKPAPKQAVARAPRPARRPQPADRSAEETFLAASIFQDNEPRAWLYRNGTRQTVLRKNSKIAVGDVQAVVEDIQPDYVVLQSDGKLWRLRIGRNLKSLEEIPNSETLPSKAVSFSRP